MAASSVRRVAVVGAGISGVNTAAHLLAEGLDVTVFEQSSTVGGIWVFNPAQPLEPAYPSARPLAAASTFHEIPEDADPHILFSSPGACYEALRNNIPTQLMEVSLNAWRPGTAAFTTHDVLAEYIQDTAAKTGVSERVQLNTKVTLVEKQQGVWRVATSTWDAATKTTSSRDWSFDAVVVASGHYHVPKVPPIPGLAAWKAAFPSRVQHSKAYRNADGFAGQTVLIIGGSASSTDIAVDLGPVAKKVWQSTRDGAFDLPPHKLPENGERVGEIGSFGPLAADHAAAAAPIPGTVTLRDGRVLAGGVDRVIVATGYQFALPFLPHLHRDDLAPQAADDRVLVTADGQQLHNLHEHIFYTPDPTLAFVGVPFYAATFSLFEFQAVAVAAFLAGRTPPLPPAEEQRAAYAARVAAKGYGKPFHSLWGEDPAYAARLMAWVNAGRAPADRKPDGYSAAWLAARQALAALHNREKVLFKGDRPPGA